MATTLTTALQGVTPRMINVEQGNGTLTRAGITAMKVQDFEDFDNKEVRMEQVIGNMAEARLAGARERSLDDLLLSRHVPLRSTTIQSNGSVIAPFDLVPQRSIFNFNYFTVTGGVVAAHTDTTMFSGSGATDLTIDAAATTGAGAAVPYSGSTTAGWVLTVTAGTADDPSGSGITATNFNKEGVKNIGAYFLPGSYIVVETIGTKIDDTASTTPAGDYAASASYTIVYKVIGARSYVDSGVEKAQVVVVPTLLPATYVALSANGKDKWHATGGGGRFLANSVSDYESYSLMTPTVNPTHLIAYWDQCQRWVDVYNDEYLKALNAPLTTSFWKKFKTLPLADQRRQRYMRTQQEFTNTVFFGTAISDKQTVATYTDLEAVKDVLDVNLTMEYKSNTIGIRPQLAAFSRVHNAAGAALNLDTLREACYQLKRNRENASSGEVLEIEAMTDRLTASNIRHIMMKYYKQHFSADVSMNCSLDQKIIYSPNGNPTTLWRYDRFCLPDEGIDLVVITDPYFDDRIAAMPTDLKTRVRALYMIDWSDIQIGVKRTRSVKRETNIADDQFNYVIQPNARHVMLNSKLFQVRVGDPNRHAIIENFSSAAPTITTLAGGVIA